MHIAHEICCPRACNTPGALASSLIQIPVLGVNKTTLELLEKGKYDEVFEKPKYVETITAERSGIPQFNCKFVLFLLLLLLAPVIIFGEIESINLPIKSLRVQ